MGASVLLQIVQQGITNQTQARQCKRTESTSSYEQSRKVSMHSTSCCDSNASDSKGWYCNVSPREDLVCYVAPASEYMDISTAYKFL